ncbi:TPA: CD1375 family protein [Listeria monocytogenes]|nr:CD1375 family protein [Listeria seeligeri]
MAAIYANLILNGAKSFEDVPKMLQKQVKVLLTELGCEELTK